MKTDTNKFVVYDFWHPQCAPCRAFSPMFNKWAEKYGDKAEFVKVNIFDEENADFVKEVEISAVPTVTITKDDEEVARFVGVPKLKDVLAVLDA